MVPRRYLFPPRPSPLNVVPAPLRFQAFRFAYTDAGQLISFFNYWRDTAPDARAAYLQHDALLPVLDNDPEAAATPPAMALNATARKANFLRVQRAWLACLRVSIEEQLSVAKGLCNIVLVVCLCVC
jgi:hypothetical protein